MIEEIIKLLNAQLDGFYRKIEKNPKDADLQAQYWELIAGHEKIINKAKGLLLSEQYNRPKKKINHTRSEKSTRMENSIYNIIESNGGTANNNEIATGLQCAKHHLYYYIPFLIDDKRIVKIRPGTYAICNTNTKGAYQ